MSNSNLSRIPEFVESSGDEKSRFYKLPATLACREDVMDSAKLVYARLASHLGRNSFAFPSHASLAADLGKKTRTIRHALRQLADLGLVRMEKGQRANHYFLSGNGLPVSELQSGNKARQTGRKASPDWPKFAYKKNIKDQIEKKNNVRKPRSDSEGDVIGEALAIFFKEQERGEDVA